MKVPSANGKSHRTLPAGQAGLVAALAAAALTAAQPAGAQVVMRPTLSADAAARMTSACTDVFKAEKFAGVVAVVDDTGHLMNFARMDGVRYNAVEFTIRKARSAYEAGRSTAELQEAFSKGSNAALVLNQFPYAGGHPVVVGGVIIGGLAGGGGDRAIEERCAQAALAVVAR